MGIINPIRGNPKWYEGIEPLIPLRRTDYQGGWLELATGFSVSNQMLAYPYGNPSVCVYTLGGGNVDFTTGMSPGVYGGYLHNIRISSDLMSFENSYRTTIKSYKGPNYTQYDPALHVEEGQGGIGTGTPVKYRFDKPSNYDRMIRLSVAAIMIADESEALKFSGMRNNYEYYNSSGSVVFSTSNSVNFTLNESVKLRERCIGRFGSYGNLGIYSINFDIGSESLPAFSDRGAVSGKVWPTYRFSSAIDTSKTIMFHHQLFNIKE